MDTGSLSGFYLGIVELSEQLTGGPEVIKTQGANGTSHFFTTRGILA